MRDYLHKQRIVSILVICMLCIGIVGTSVQSVFAAANYVLEEGKSRTVQLDGKGAKEKIRFEITVEEKYDGTDVSSVEKEDILYRNTFTLYINDRAVYDKTIITPYRENYEEPGEQYQKLYGDVYIGSVDKNRKVRDIFIAIYDRKYIGTYEALDYCRFENGKLKKIQDLKNYLYKTLSGQIGGLTEENKEKFCYFHPMYKINDSLKTTGDNELIVTICLPDNDYQADPVDILRGTYHADYTLKLKNGKLVKKYSIAQGDMHDSAVLEKSVKFYTEPGGTKKSFTGKKGKIIYFVEYKYVNDVLYLKGKNEDGKMGWTKASERAYYVGKHV